MRILKFPYTSKSHSTWGSVAYPFVKVDFYSTMFGQWLRMGEVLADTGADLSVMPLHVGQALVPVVELGIPIRLGGSVVSENGPMEAFIHRVTTRLGDVRFEMPLAIAVSSAVPIILGRREALDRFSVQFVKGKEVIIKLE